MHKRATKLSHQCWNCHSWQTIDFEWLEGQELTDDDGNNYWVDRYHGNCPNCLAVNRMSLLPDSSDEPQDHELWRDDEHGFREPPSPPDYYYD